MESLIGPLLKLLLVLVFILINAFFAGTEMAIITLNDAKMRKMSEEGHKGARRILRLIDNPSTFLATIQVGVTMAGFLSSAFAANSFATKLALIINPQNPDGWAQTLATVIITMILSYFSLIFGELVPKRVAQKYPERWSFAAVGVVTFFKSIAKPFVKLLTVSTNAILRLFGIDPDSNDPEVTEEEIRLLVDVGSESGMIEDSEKKMIERVFEFNDKEVSEIMTHRKKIVSLPIDADFDAVLKLAREEKYTRIPVYKDTIDDIVGILHIKDLIGITPSNGDEEFKLEKLIRKPLFVHETRNISTLFTEMKTSGMQMAIILDEYGGTMGICTIEDMLEEIVGNIVDEFDDKDTGVTKLANGDLIVKGDMTLSDLENEIDIEFTEDEYDTIAGLVTQLLDRVPDENEHSSVTYKNLDIKVLEVKDRWISKVMIHVNPVDNDDNQEDDRD